MSVLWTCLKCAEKSNETGEGSGAQILQGACERAGTVQSEKRRLGGDLMPLYSCLRGASSMVWVSLFSR